MLDIHYATSALSTVSHQVLVSLAVVDAIITHATKQ